ncbi:MAG: hypothetical protein FD123_840 [Bacteroidetes bacterium]|nr:MAG: hypothetical protein FD123_840 [Bacteroidota bacterium]
MKTTFKTIALAATIIGINQTSDAQTLYTPGPVQSSTTSVIGIGTSVPRGNLEIFPICSSGGITPSLLLSKPGSFVCTNPQVLGNYLEVREYNYNNTSFTMPFMIANNGRIGLNTTAPLTKFDLYTTVANDGIRITQTSAHGAVLGLYNTTAGGHNWTLFSTGNGNTQGSGNFMIYDYSAPVNQNNRFLIQGTTGYVGLSMLGSTAPTAKLDINAIGGHKGINITADRPDWSYGIHYQHQGTNGLCKAIAVSKQGQDVFVVHSNGATVIGYVANATGIAESNPNNSAYKLYVEKGILTEKVKVALQGSLDWSDYVFAPEYKRNSLDYIERYVKEHQHLPNVPAASEVVANGIDLGQMDATLLRQIEELWLTVIDLKKENEELRKLIKQ